MRQSELSDDVCTLDHVAKLFKRHLSVLIFVGFDDCFVDNLLELGVLEVVSDHRLEDLCIQTVFGPEPL